MSSLLSGVKPTDPLTFFSVLTLLLLVALSACLFPAWRAMRIDPMTATELHILAVGLCLISVLLPPQEPSSGGRPPALWRVFQQSAKFLPQLRRVLVTVDAHSVHYGCVSTSRSAPEIANVQFASFGNSLQSMYFLAMAALQLIGCATKDSPWRRRM